MTSAIPEILKNNEKEILQEWVREQLTSSNKRIDLVSDETLNKDSIEFLSAFRECAQSGNFSDISGNDWKRCRESLAQVSASRARVGFSPGETAMFVFSLKKPIFNRLQTDLAKNPSALMGAIWSLTIVLDKLGLYTTEVYQKSREEIIARQQDEMLELSTPVVKLWDGVLALPMIGTLDSSRTQMVMENLLQRIVETGSEIAIIDITGVPTVDTLVAQHLLKTVTAAQLMGAECIISGIRPQIASTIVHLGVELGDVITKANLADAFKVALKRLGKTKSTEGYRGSSKKSEPHANGRTSSMMLTEH